MAAWLARAGAALGANRGGASSPAGPAQPAEVHALVHRINGALGNTGATVLHTAPVPVLGAEPLAELTQAMARGEVGTLLMLGVNPVYDAPGDLAFSEHLERVPFRIHANTYADETAAHADWHLPLAPSAGELGRRPRPRRDRGADPAHRGAPLWRPLRAGDPDPVRGRDPGHGGAGAGLALLKRQWRGPGEDEATFEARFTEALRLGFLPDSALAHEAVTLTGGVAAAVPEGSTPTRIEAVFRPDPCLWDGAFADLGWLQELPKPLTKVVCGERRRGESPRLAEDLHLATGDIVAVEANGKRIEGAAWILPGQASAA